MKVRLVATVLSASLLAVVTAASADPATAARDAATGVGHDLAKAGRATGRALANGGREVVHATRATGHDAAKGVRHTARPIRHPRRRRHHDG